MGLKNSIINADCFDVLSETKNDTFDHCLTSPPYNRKRNDKYIHHDDSINDYLGFISRLASECMRVCRGFVFLNIQKNYYNKKDVFSFLGKYSDWITEVIVWNKSNPMPASGNSITNAYELFVVLSKHKKPLKSNKTYTLNSFTTNVFSSNPYSDKHKAVMHPDACMYILKNFVLSGDFVIDPMCGVGTTLKTCKSLGIDYLGIEMSSEYFNICVDNVENFILEGK